MCLCSCPFGTNAALLGGKCSHRGEEADCQRPLGSQQGAGYSPGKQNNAAEIKDARNAMAAGLEVTQAAKLSVYTLS